MEFIHSDGGREKAGYKGSAGDCVVRAISIITEKSYQEVYDDLFKFSGKTPRDGVAKKICREYMKSLGFTWVPTMLIGQGCKVHLRKDELPKGRLVVAVSKHYTAVIDGIIYDTHECSREGTRCVYGYYKKN